jgi:hypothetical protein
MSAMTIADAQAEVRSVYVFGTIGQAVSGMIWLASAVAASAGSIRLAILVVVVGGWAGVAYARSDRAAPQMAPSGG